jgi:transcriptional regulator with XRE-family HTH domain
MDTTAVLIGKRIKQLRMEYGITQTQLGYKLDCERQYVCNLEKGLINLSAECIDKLANAFNITPAQFLQINV